MKVQHQAFMTSLTRDSNVILIMHYSHDIIQQDLFNKISNNNLTKYDHCYAFPQTRSRYLTSSRCQDFYFKH